MTYHRDGERARLDAATAAQTDPFATLPNADDRAYELERANLASARSQAQLHGPPPAPIRLFSGKLFTPGPRQAVPLASGISGETALGLLLVLLTTTRSRPSDDQE